mmetsp:Transcript_34940/g.93732  ORF Transcript_34940/g.93732 Transcript_34940/m.93732 type:complete len:232 (+) Transcript_34940:479-1174(+)
MSSSPGACRYHSTRFATSTSAVSSSGHHCPENVCHTPSTLISTNARHPRASSSWQLQTGGGLPCLKQWVLSRDTSLCRPSSLCWSSSRSVQSAQQIDPARGGVAQSTFGVGLSVVLGVEVPEDEPFSPCRGRNTGPSRPGFAYIPSARSAASRCARFLEGIHTPATWCGTPESTKATVARNSKFLPAIRVPYSHCSTEQLAGILKSLPSSCTNSCSAEMGPRLLASEAHML